MLKLPLKIKGNSEFVKVYQANAKFCIPLILSYKNYIFSTTTTETAAKQQQQQQQQQQTTQREIKILHKMSAQ